jgi:hypothetical protein
MSLGETELRFEKGPDLFIIATLVFPPLPQEGSRLAIAISAIREKVGAGLLRGSRGRRVVGSLGHEVLLSGQGSAQFQSTIPRSKERSPRCRPLRPESLSWQGRL